MIFLFSFRLSSVSVTSAALRLLCIASQKTSMARLIEVIPNCLPFKKLKTRTPSSSPSPIAWMNRFCDSQRTSFTPRSSSETNSLEEMRRSTIKLSNNFNHLDGLRMVIRQSSQIRHAFSRPLRHTPDVLCADHRTDQGICDQRLTESEPSTS